MARSLEAGSIPAQHVVRGREASRRTASAASERLRSVVDRHVHIDEGHPVEARLIEDALHRDLLRERERIGCSGPMPRCGLAAREGRAGSPRTTRCDRGPARPIITNRASGRSARARLAKAATGSAKNIVPNLLITTSKCPEGKLWDCASPTSKVTLRSPSASLRARARARSSPPEMSTPSALPAAAIRPASRVVSPAPQPISRMRSSGRMPYERRRTRLCSRSSAS